MSPPSADLPWAEVQASTNGKLGEFNVPCPLCGPDRSTLTTQRKPVMKIWRQDRDYATFHCVRCGVSGWTRPDAEPRPERHGRLWEAMHSSRRRAASPSAGAPTAEGDVQAAPVDADRLARLSKVGFAEFTVFHAGDIVGTLAEAYLANRHLASGQDLRFSLIAPRSYDAGKGHGPGMVAAVRDLAGAVIGCQITYLGSEGRKLTRLTFGCPAGGAVQLAPVGADGVLAVGEGVETCLAYSVLYGVPCWAALSTSGLIRFMPPPGLRRLIVAADNDASGAGIDAARKLALRVRAQCEVVIQMPAKTGEDWADVLLQSGRAAA